MGGDMSTLLYKWGEYTQERKRRPLTLNPCNSPSYMADWVVALATESLIASVCFAISFVTSCRKRSRLEYGSVEIG